MNFGDLDATTGSHPNRGESLILLATELKSPEDSHNEPGDAPQEPQVQIWVSNLLDIQAARRDVVTATANQSRRGRRRKIRR